MKKMFFGCLVLMGLFGIVFLAKSFSISPVKQIITLDPGDSRIIKIKIRNTEKSTTKYKTTILGAKQSLDGFPIYANGIEEAESWVKSEQEFIEILPGKELEASFVVSIPKDALPGSHYLGLSVEPVMEKEKNLTGKLISILSIEVSGEVSETLSILNWNGEKSLYFDLKKVKLYAILKNESVAEVPIKGKIRVYNWLNRKTAEEDVYLSNSILPQTKIETQVLLPQNGNWFLPGVYRVQLDLAYGRTGQRISAQYPFWYISKGWLITVSLIFLALLIILLKKRVNKKEV